LTVVTDIVSISRDQVLPLQEPLTGDRAGQHSIRVNDQFRTCFRWTDPGPEDVEIVDYH
jgi:plasmid maintenance system killer protein